MLQKIFRVRLFLGGKMQRRENRLHFLVFLCLHIIDIQVITKQREPSGDPNRQGSHVCLLGLSPSCLCGQVETINISGLQPLECNLQPRTQRHLLSVLGSFPGSRNTGAGRVIAFQKKDKKCLYRALPDTFQARCDCIRLKNKDN